MADLAARSSAEGRLPLTRDSVTLSERPMAPITWLAPLSGQRDRVAAALRDAYRLEWPTPDRFTEAGDLRAVWAGAGQVHVLGAAVGAEGAAIADLSDAWTWLALEGAEARGVLARLTPIDLRPGRFGPGGAARTLLFHMTATLLCTGRDSFEILVFRSMAETAVHELARAMDAVAARAAL